MRPILRRIMRWALGLLIAALIAVAGYTALVTLPGPLFAHKESHGAYRVYSDKPLPGDIEQTLADLDKRLRAMEHKPPAGVQRIYLCGPKKYGFFAFLLRKSPDSLAIGLSAANETFANVGRLRLFAEKNRGALRHTRFEGNLAEAVAHEVAHFNSVHALGYREHLRQPVWKGEGWAEYQANLAVIRADPDYDLAARIDVLLDDGYWGGRHATARFLWESQLLVEFLGEREGYRLDDLVRDEVTEARTRERMMTWYDDRAR